MDYYELYILDTNFEVVALVDKYESFIWTERYKECGDFELYLGMSIDIFNSTSHGNYVWIKQSDRLMIIESTEITTDLENGSHLKLTGRSLESILDRRIIWHQITVEGDVQTVVKQLINDQIINPTLTERKISNFVFIDSEDPYILGCEIEKVQFLGENLYDVLIDILEIHSIGFKIIYNFSTGNFEFSLYYGIDRTYSQTDNPWVVFSSKNENLISSDYIENSATYKNANLVAGEDPQIYDFSEEETYVVNEIVKKGEKYYKCIVAITTPGSWNSDNWEEIDTVLPSRKFVYVVDSDTTIPSGLNRYEMFTDGSSKQQKYTDEDENLIKLTDGQYISVLRELGFETLFNKENRKTTSVDGEMNTVTGLKYGSDFYLGDVVQIENEYGINGTARVIELIMSQDTSGVMMYPTFEAIN